jgi:hypothetical protein
LFSPNLAVCDDADACTTADTCDGAGVCAGGPPLACDDENVCTADSCDTQQGCVFNGPLVCEVPDTPGTARLWLGLMLLTTALAVLAHWTTLSRKR